MKPGRIVTLLILTAGLLAFAGGRAEAATACKEPFRKAEIATSGGPPMARCNIAAWRRSQ